MKFPVRLGITAAIVVAAGGLLLSPIGQRWFGSPTRAPSVTVSGNIEAHQSVLSFTGIQAPISWLAFDEGKSVQVGTVLAKVDDRYYQQQLRIDRAASEVMRRQLGVAQSGLAVARKTVASDRFDLAQKQRDLTRDAAQLKIGALSSQVYDLANTTTEQTRVLLARDQALVQQASDNIELARANLAAAITREQLDQVTLSYTVLQAPFSGVLAVREAELGELAGPGVAIFTLDDLDHVWLRAYVNETNLGQVRLGQAVNVSTDTWPDKIYHGHIGFIASDAEFTPKTVETHAERVTLVYRLRIDIDNPTHELLPGMPAEARIALIPAGK